MSRIVCTLGCVVLTLVTVSLTGGDSSASDDAMSNAPTGPGVSHHPWRQTRQIIQVAKKKPKKKAAPKKGAADDTAEPAEKKDDATAKPQDAAKDGLKFSRDIAPVLVSNCARCHNERDMTKNGKLDMTTFDKLMNQKAKSGDVVVVPGKPEESHLYLRLTGEETPKMPRPGGNRRFNEAKIEVIGQWIKEGARLDAGIDPKATLASYALTKEQIRKDELAKMPAAEREKLVETKGIVRWKKGNAKGTPEVTPGKNFVLIGAIPKDRAAATVKALENQYAHLKSLSPSASAARGDVPQKRGAAPSEPLEKIGLYVFNERTSFVEFVRSNEKREIDASEQGTANLGAEPYVAVLDPLGGKPEPAGGTAKKATRSKKKDDDESPATDRSLLGLLTEQLAAGLVKQDGKAPTWLSSGVGAYYGIRVDARSAYARRVRRTLYEVFNQGWVSKASDALGTEGKPEDTRAVGFGIVDAILSTPQYRPYFPAFVAQMREGGDKLDDALQKVLNMSREDFLQQTGAFVESHVGG
jgi:hypothetical protein